MAKFQVGRSTDAGFVDGFTVRDITDLSLVELTMLRSECDGSLSAALGLLRDISPFYFSLIMQVGATFTTNIPRAATNGREILLHPVWFNGNPTFGAKEEMPIEYRMGVLLHEILHIVMLNRQRMQWRDPSIWNQATDIVNNGLIRKQFGTPLLDENGNPVLHETTKRPIIEFDASSMIRLPPNVVIREDLEDFRAEEVYDKLVQEFEDNPSGQCRSGQCRPGKGQWKTVSPGAHHHNDGDEEYDPGCFHDFEDFEGDDENAEGQMKNIVRRALNEARSQGKLPAGLEEAILRELGESVVNWREILQNFATKSYEDFQGPYDRRFISQGFYFDTLESDNVTMYVCIDTSGSIAEKELKKFLAEVTEIVRLYPRIEGKGFWADADLYGPVEIEQMAQSHPMGGGGTSFVPFFEWIRDNHSMAHGGVPIAVYFTDGYGTFPSEAPDIDTLWVVVSGGAERERFPFGEVVRMIETEG